MRLRKEEEIERPIGHRAEGEAGHTKILTSCPACFRGVFRQEAMDVMADNIDCEFPVRTRCAADTARPVKGAS